MKLSRQPCHRWLAAPVTESDVTRAYRVNTLFDAHRDAHGDDPEFGHRLLVDEARDTGESMADKTAWRVCRDNSWWSVLWKKRDRNGKKHGPAVPYDLCTVVDMNGRTRNKFTADSPNQLWCRAIEDRRPYSTGRSRKFLRALARFRMVGSMGPVVSCGDNSAMESFFSLLQKNVLNRRSWTTHNELRTAIVMWIERAQHRPRRQPHLVRLTPIEFETIMKTPAALAA